MALDYDENCSSNEYEESKEVPSNKMRSGLAGIVVQEDFPDSDKEEDNDGSEGIDEGFLQVASAGSLNTGSY